MCIRSGKYRKTKAFYIAQASPILGSALFNGLVVSWVGCHHNEFVAHVQDLSVAGNTDMHTLYKKASKIKVTPHKPKISIMTIIYLNVSLSQNYQPGAASTQGDESFRYLFGCLVCALCFI